MPEETRHPWPDKYGFKAHLLDTLDRPQLFSVVTWGCCASTWLAKVLDSHPDIFCLHAFNQHYALTSMSGENNDLGYLESIAISAHAYAAAGDIHGVGRESIPLLHKHFQDRFHSAVLVRAPWERFHSMLSCMKRLKGGLSDYSYIDKRLGGSLSAGQLSLADRIFAHSVNMLNAITEETRYCETIFKMEDIIASPEHLAQLVRHITGGTVPVTPEWVEAALKTKKANTHIRQCPPPTTFNAKEKQMIAAILKPGALDLYRQMGYLVDPFREIINA